MAGLVISNETGTPHAAVLLHFLPPAKPRWLGFFPNGELFLKTGVVNDDSRDSLIENYIRFEVSEAKLNRILESLVAQYNTKDYNLGICDCVSFAADACRTAGIGVPLINSTPYGLVKWLHLFTSTFTHYNIKPYPWVTLQTPEKVTATVARVHKVRPGDTLMKISRIF